MSKKITYQELEKIVQASKVGVRVRVDSDPYGKGYQQILTFAYLEDAYYGGSDLSTYGFNQDKIDGISYSYSGTEWQEQYKGTFELVEELPVKPEVYAVGDWVVVLEEFKKCKDWNKYCRNSIGKIYKIQEVGDSNFGINYYLESGNGQGDGYHYPHYAVQRVNPPEPTPEIIEVNDKTYNKSEYDWAIAGLKEVK